MRRRTAFLLMVGLLASCSGGDSTDSSACETTAVGSLSGHVDGARTVDVWLLDESLNPRRPLTRDHKSYGARLSPDGSRIIYATGRGHPSDAEAGNSQWAVFVMNADGSGDHRVTDGPLDRWPDWSPDSRSILFRRGAPDGSAGIVIRHLATGAERQLTRDAQVIYSDPMWAPRGDYIAAKAWDAASSTDHVAVLDAETGREVQRLGAGNTMTWDPSGTRLAVERSRFTSQQIERYVEVVEIPGGATRRVPRSGTTYATVFAWTEVDGLIFTRNIRGPGVQLVAWPESGTPRVLNAAPRIELYDRVDAHSRC